MRKKAGFSLKKSVHGSSKFSCCAFDKASFAARSASSFPLISLWLGSQQNVINLPLDSSYKHVLGNFLLELMCHVSRRSFHHEKFWVEVVPNLCIEQALMGGVKGV